MYSITERARDFARNAHAGQLDRQGRDYFEFHLRPVAESLTGESDVAVAAGWLHDVVEDTPVTLEEVHDEFGAEVAAAVEACTRRPGEMYFDFIRRAAQHPVGRKVKYRDNRRNLSDETSLRRRYEKAAPILLGAADA